MKILILLVSGLVATPLVIAQTNLPPSTVQITPEFVNQLADEARTNNPALQGADIRVSAAEVNERTVRTWEDPVAGVGFMAAERMMRAEDGDIIYGIDQKLPLFGKPKAAREVAKAETGVETANLDYRFQQLRKEIAQSVFRLGLAERELAIGRQDAAWLETMLAVAVQRYETGDATQTDVLRLQNERSKTLNDLKTDEQQAEQQRSILNLQVGRDLHAAWPRLELPDIGFSIPYDTRLVRLAVGNEPRLKVLRQEIKRAEAMTEKARRDRYPDVMAGAEVRNYSGNGEFRQGMVTLSVSIPWGNRKKYDAEIKREELNRQAIASEATNYQREVHDEIYRLTLKIDAARREALLYRDEIIPRSELALDSARVAWEANRGMFGDLLEARRMLLDAQVMYARAVAEQYEMMAELVLCCGLGDLEALQMLSAPSQAETIKN